MNKSNIKKQKNPKNKLIKISNNIHEFLKRRSIENVKKQHWSESLSAFHIFIEHSNIKQSIQIKTVHISSISHRLFYRRIV